MLHRLHRLLSPGAADGVVPAAPPVGVRAIVRRFWPDARPHRRWIAAGLLFTAALPAVATAEIWLFKLVVDDVLVPRDLGALAPIALAYLGLALASAVLAFGEDYLATRTAERFVLGLRGRVFAHLQALSPDALGRRRLGDLLARLTGDVQAIERFVLSGLGDALSALARIALFSGALFLLSWRLALAALVAVPLFWLAARRFSGLVRSAAREKRRRSGTLTALAEESLANTALVQSLNREATETRRVHAEGAAILEAELAATRIRGLFGPVVDLVELAGGLAVVALGVWALGAGGLTLGGLLAFLAYLSQLYGPARELGRLTTRLYAASAGAERIIELLDERPAVADAPGARTLRRTRGDVELRAVSHRTLSGVSLHVRPGETVALTGPSGAGKTSLAGLLLRFADPDAGSVLLDGHDLRDLTLRSIREQVGLLPQETLLFDATVAENIAYGRPGATPEQIRAAAEATGAAALGLDTPAGPRGRRLSGGERQRVALARTLLRDTPVVVLDEPTTGLDAVARDEVLAGLEPLLAGRTTIVISHDPAVIARADRVIALHGDAVLQAA